MGTSSAQIPSSTAVVMLTTASAASESKASESKAGETAFALPCSFEKYEKIQNLFEQYHLPHDRLFSEERTNEINIESLKKEFNSLAELEKKLEYARDKLAVKKYKINLMQAIKAELEALNIAPPPSNEQASKPSRLLMLAKKCGYLFLLFFGSVINGVGGFVGFKEILGLIFSGISNPLLIAISASFCLVEMLLFYSFEAGMLRTMLGTNELDEESELIQADIKELSLIDDLNQLTRQHSNCLDSPQFSLISSINENGTDIAKKYNNNKPQEKIAQKVARHAVTGIGAIMVAAGSYFGIKSLLVSLGAIALVGTPPGWALAVIGISMAVWLTYFMSMRGSSAAMMFIPAARHFDEAKNISAKFKPENEFTLQFNKNAKLTQLKYENLRDTSNHMLYQDKKSQKMVTHREIYRDREEKRKILESHLPEKIQRKPSVVTRSEALSHSVAVNGTAVSYSSSSR